jgi:hypothetical protein
MTKTTKKQRERAKRIKELKAGRWCWTCTSWFDGVFVTKCAHCEAETKGRKLSGEHPRFKPRRIGRKEVVP